MGNQEKELSRPREQLEGRLIGLADRELWTLRERAESTIC